MAFTASSLSIKGIPQYISWGETFNLEGSTITVKTGTNDSTAAGGQMQLDYFPSVSTEDPLSESLIGITGSKYSPFIDFNLEMPSIGKSATKTITYSGTTTKGTPSETAVMYYSQTTKAKDHLMQYYGLSDSVRAYPLKVHVQMWNASGSSVISSKHTTNITFLTSRARPTITDFSLSETNPIAAKPIFGSYVQGVSSLVCNASFVLDPLVPILTGVHKFTLTDPDGDVKIVDAETEAGATSVSLDIGTLEKAGTYSYRYTVLYRYGNGQSISTNETGTFEVLAYEAPVLSPKIFVDSDGNQTTVPYIERYSEVRTDTGVEYIADDIGERVWMTFLANVHPISGNGNTNGWTVTVGWTASNGVTGSKVILSQTQGSELIVNEDRTLLTDTFQAGASFNFTITVADRFNEYLQTLVVDKGDGYMQVDTYCASFGMLSTATPDNPKFECAFPAYFYGGIQGVGDYSLVEVKTGGKWIDGKPIYCKTVHKIGTSYTHQSSVRTITLASGIENIDTVVDVRGVAKFSSSSLNTLPMPFASPNGAAYDCSLYLGTDGTITFQLGTSRDIYSPIMTFYYTKTTDTATIQI